MNLEEYVGKDVIIETKTDGSFKGLVDAFTSAADNDDTEDSISLMTDKEARAGFEFMESDILSISLI